jgi:hypothetical protein
VKKESSLLLIVSPKYLPSVSRKGILLFLVVAI